eukprot:4689578-Pyramimonas_sp.AAC.1
MGTSKLERVCEQSDGTHCRITRAFGPAGLQGGDPVKRTRSLTPPRNAQDASGRLQPLQDAPRRPIIF